jgi:hypothetical protein
MIMVIKRAVIFFEKIALPQVLLDPSSTISHLVITTALDVTILVSEMRKEAEAQTHLRSPQV